MIGTSTAFAAIESNAYISSFSGAVSVANDGTVTVNFGTIGTSYMDKVGASAISVYENGSWVATYYYSNPKYTATMMGTNVHYFYGYVTYSGTKGNTYQAHILRRQKDAAFFSQKIFFQLPFALLMALLYRG